MRMINNCLVSDLDGTYTRDQQLVFLIEALIKENIFPKEAGEEYGTLKREWLEKSIFQTFITGLVLLFKKYLEGKNKAEVVKIAEELVNNYPGRLYPFVSVLHKKAKDSGFYTILLSHSPDFLVSIIGKKLGFDFAKGIYYDVDADGCFTGKCDSGDALNKKKVLLQIFEYISVERIAKISYEQLEALVVIGDSIGDVSMFELAKTAVCYNPTKNLINAWEKSGNKWVLVAGYKNMVVIEGIYASVYSEASSSFMEGLLTS